MSHALPPLPEWLSRKIALANSRTQLTSALTRATALLRLQSSTQSGGDWTNWADTKNVNPAASTSATRRPAVAASASGVPLAVFDGAAVDVVSWPVITNNNGASKYGFWLRVKPTSTVTGSQYLMSESVGTGGASANKMNLQLLATGIVQVDLYFGGTVRTFKSVAAAVSTSVSTSIGFTYDSTGTLETDKFKMIVGGVYVASTGSGSGVPGTLPVPTGNIVIGNYQDAAGGAVPFSGTVGPNILGCAAGHFTAAELVALNNWETF